HGGVLADEDLQLWQDAKEETSIHVVMSHASYLINLASPKEDSQAKSHRAFGEEIQRCIDLDITYLNFHPGSCLQDSPEAGLQRIVDNLLQYRKQLEGTSLRLLLESTAGTGSNLGWRFEELGWILERVKDELPIGVCIDTCHCFAAGYDIRDAKGCAEMLALFDKHVGLEHLYAFHLNDSKEAFGSHKDRHADLGEGEIGIECFRYLMQNPRTQKLPKYLETPGRLEIWPKEIALLRTFAAEAKS
ncbi:MAG: deoxyribonuclease IV, partial [Chlamydiia bacterium]|nr:deoxyribonuclease IV [Chlamydiia bacterium]